MINGFPQGLADGATRRAKGRGLPTVGVFCLTLIAGFAGMGAASADDDDKIDRQLSQFEVTRLQTLARQGNADAEYRLGVAYGTGTGLPRDPTLAMIHISQAAARGHPLAQYDLGLYYENNLHLEGARIEAEKWYRLAAENGHGQAQARLAQLQRKPTRKPSVRLYMPSQPRAATGTKPPEKQTSLPDDIGQGLTEPANFAIPGQVGPGFDADDARDAKEEASNTDAKRPIAVADLPAGRKSCQALFSRLDDRIKAVAPDAVDDPDIARNRVGIHRAKLCLGLYGFEDGGRSWVVQYLFNPDKQPGPVWAVPHDHENAAFDSMVRLVTRYGGGAVVIDADEGRRHLDQDPNHVFATTRSQARRCGAAKNPYPRLVEAIMAGLKVGEPERLFLSLHSNDDGFRMTGGQGTISVNRTSLSMEPFPATKAVAEFQDEDNLVIVSRKSRAKLDTKSAKMIKYLNANGLHVVLEKVTKRGNDCSLSNYVILNNLGDYYNIEVQHGQSEVQVKMAEILLKGLGVAVRAGEVADNFIIPGGG